LVVAALAFGVTEFGRFVGRPYVRQTGIDDFGLTDSIGNLGGIVVQIFAVLALCNTTRLRGYCMAAFMAAGYVAYEFAQPFLPRGTFDWYDVIATGLGLGLSVPVLWLIWRLLPPREEADLADQPRP
jgi:hypothetical protein